MRLKSLVMWLSTVSAVAGFASAANAAVIDLTFEGINTTSGNAQILNFYSGGISSDGSSGTNYGISFPSNALALCLNTLTTTCSSTSHGGLGDPASVATGLFFLVGGSTFLDDPAGFTTGFSFDYTAVNQGGSVEVFSGLDGAGTLLATLNLPTTPLGPCPGFVGAFCPFVDTGVGFAGTGESIAFIGAANQIVFDDVTFGSATVGGPGPTGVPEPITLSLFGAGLVGAAALRRRQKKSA